MSRPELLSLLEACKRDPDDEATRSVLADWLEEHGSDSERERADFIRMELEWGLDRGRPDLYYRRRRIWNEKDDEWAPYQRNLKQAGQANPDYSLVWVDASFKGLTGAKAQRWAGTEEWSWVRTLSITAKPEELPAVLGSPLLAGVPQLRMYGMSLAGDVIPTLANWKGLGGVNSLHLSHSKVGPKGLAPLLESPGASALRLLRLGHARLKTVEAELLRDPNVLPNLEVFELPGKAVLPDVAALLAGRRLRSLVAESWSSDSIAAYLGESPRLTRLRMSTATWEADAVESFNRSGLFGELEDLDLAGNTFEAELAPGPARLRPLRALRMNRVSPNAAGLLRLPGMGELTYLSMRNNDWLGAGHLTPLPTAPLTMELAGCELGDDDLKALARWKGFARCRCLHLYKNEITAAGIRALVESPNAAALESLIVPNNPIGDDGIEAIVNSPVGDNLVELMVHNCDQGDPSARALLAPGKLPRIREISFGGAARVKGKLHEALVERFGLAWC